MARPKRLKSGGLRDRQGKRLQLTVDVFVWHEGLVLADDFCHEGGRAIGEFSIEGDELLVRSASVASADVLRRRLRGFTHKERRFEEMLPEVAPVSSAADLSFKAAFFEQWLDEPLDELAGKTPRQAAEDKDCHPALRRLLARLRDKEARLEASHRYDVEALTRRLLP